MTSAQAGLVLQHLRRLAGTRSAAQSPDGQLLECFIRQRDEASFAALVRRHGPMVLGVCRSVLRHEQDAEDAFQATFLVLARKADSIRQPGAVAGWLYEVAHHVALKAQAAAARRRALERRGTPLAPADPTLDMTLRDLRRVLHEELRRLPDKYRLPLVLCYLEGRSQEEAAAQLGWSRGTVRGRLDRGREHLRRRLAARGVALSALLGATALVPAATAEGLVDLVVRSAVPARVAALAEGVTRAMFTSKLTIVTAMLLAIGLAAGAAALAARERPAESPTSEVASQKPEPPAAPAPAKPTAEQEKDDSAEVSGRVVGPDGKPFAGAKVFFARYILHDPPPGTSTAATSDAEGRFRLRVSRTGYPEQYMKAQWMRGAVVAVGRGFAFGWVGADSAEKLGNVTVKLAPEVPITGRVVDLQGQPVAGVSVQVRNVRCREDGGDLKALVEALRAKGEARDPSWPGLWLDPALLGLPRPAVTGADGTFRVTGISGECLVGLRFAGPTIEAAEVYAMTRPAPTVVTPRSESRPELGNRAWHGNAFDHAAAPTRPVVGVVRDRDTGKPLAGVTVRALMGPAREHFVGDPYLETTTDEEGRYRLVGLARELKQRLEAFPAPGQPYLPVGRTPAAAPGLGPVTLDFALKRGIPIRGRVTNKATGRPMPALVTYFAFADNPQLREAPGLLPDRRADVHGAVRTADDGSFTLVGLPGRGLLAAKAAGRPEQGRYIMGQGDDDIKGPRFGDGFNTEPSVCDPVDFNTLVAIDPARDAGSVERDLVLDPGKTVTGTIVDPDDKPVKGAGIETVRGVWFHVKDLPAAEFRIPGVDPKHPRWYFVRHPDRNLGAIVQFKGDEPMPVTVRLQKCATVTGRVVDEDGQPRAAWVAGHIHRGQLDINETGVALGMQGTGKDGRFRIEGVIPGLKIGLLAGKNTTYFDTLVPELTLKPGEVKDVGDVKFKPSQ
jgi:RNA polymerase sigma factor (sigma-70 family)